MTTVYLNGTFVPETEAKISILDRGFLYGDALFETMRVCRGKPFLWHKHFERMRLGAEFLKINFTISEQALFAAALQLVQSNQSPESVLRIQLSRDKGQRGYSTRGAAEPQLVMTVHPAPALDEKHPLQWELKTASFRILKNDPLARIKTSNKLLQVLARTEAEDHGCNEALLVNNENELAETTSGNLFWVENGTVCTPPETAGILPGITRATVLKLCRDNNIPCTEKTAGIEALLNAEGAFVTSSVLEIVEVTKLDGRTLASSPVTKPLWSAYRELTRRGD